MPLYGDQTRKAIENFPISGWPVARQIVHALALIKEHAARVNGDLGQIPKAHAIVIANAAKKVQTGEFDNEFPVDVFQTGSGTSTNMNVNEVIAALASSPGRKIHPNDHVNCCQSTNDAFPSAVQIACALAVRDELLPELEGLRKTLLRKGKQFHAIIKTGRTHLMDAVPIRLGDEFAGYAALIETAQGSLRTAQKNLCMIPLGGTAVGTGINAHPQFAGSVIARIARSTKLPLRAARNRMAAQSCPLAFLSASGALRETGAVLGKIAGDIEWMASGPVAGLAELTIPSVQPGSSIMPGKDNPVLCESVLHVSLYVIGTDAVVQGAINYRSTFELNTALPLIAQSLIVPIHLLTNATKVFTVKCVAGIQANRKVIAEHAARNPMLATALAPEIGYDKAAVIAREAMESGESIYDVAARTSGMSHRKLRERLDPENMV